MTVEKPRTRGGQLRVLTRKHAPEPELCILVENGVPCPRPRKTRGVCVRHHTYLRAHGTLELYGLPPQSASQRRSSLAVDPGAEPDRCRVLQDGQACSSPSRRRGLCTRHYQLVWYRSKQGELALEDYVLPLPGAREVKVRKRQVEGECRAHERGEDCRAPAHARGLCHRHYQLKGSQPALFLKVALPDPKARRYELRKRLVEGRCRVLEDGSGCPAAATTRGLCTHHYSVLRKDPELLEQLALPSSLRPRREFARADDPSPAPLTCLVLQDAVRCTRPPVVRGLCREHHRAIGYHRDYSLHDFLLPAPQSTLARKSAEASLDGRCLAVQDGLPCARERHSRGLCRRHYKQAAARGRLEELGLPARALGAPTQPTQFGAGNDLPHLYLDKNVLFDHADALVFQTSGQWASVSLVEQVMQARARASISADALKTTYNHVRHRLVRARAEGGREAEEQAAEARAREHVASTFLRGAWRVVALSPAELLEVVRHPDPRLSLEDALEFKTYQVARSTSGGPTMFVTRDADFPEGVHPAAVARELGWAF